MRVNGKKNWRMQIIKHYCKLRSSFVSCDVTFTRDSTNARQTNGLVQFNCRENHCRCLISRMTYQEVLVFFYQTIELITQASITTIFSSQLPLVVDFIPTSLIAHDLIYWSKREFLSRSFHFSIELNDEDSYFRYFTTYYLISLLRIFRLYIPNQK